MTAQGTVLLATAQAGIAAQAQRALPAYCLREIVAPPSEAEPLPTGPMWAFVDWLLPEISGLELCRRLRASVITQGAHITMVLEDMDGESRRRALRAGADDYVRGPLDVGHLLHRLDGETPAAERMHSNPVLRVGRLRLDIGAHRVSYADRPVQLKPRQFDLLHHLMRQPDRVHSRASLLRLLAGDDVSHDERTVDVWVGRLRGALQSSGASVSIRTVKNVGYVLDTV